MSDQVPPTEPAPAAVAPGWYPDPTTGARRWWDGTAWAQIVQQPPAQRFEGSAVAAFILGLGGFLIGWIWVIAWVFGVTAIIFAVLALRATRTNGRRGRALAGWGLALGIATLLFDLGVMVTALSSR